MHPMTNITLKTLTFEPRDLKSHCTLKTKEARSDMVQLDHV